MWKTLRHFSMGCKFWKHPHERGEDANYDLVLNAWSETPPRAWGRLEVTRDNQNRARNTPTSVGKTQTVILPANKSRKHPHERGEDVGFIAGDDFSLETPPRAWGRLKRCQELPAYQVMLLNASLRGKKLLAKISDEEAKANCFLSF